MSRKRHHSDQHCALSKGDCGEAPAPIAPEAESPAAGRSRKTAEAVNKGARGFPVPRFSYEKGRQLRRPYLLARVTRASCSFSHAFSCSRDSIVRRSKSTSGGSLRERVIFSWSTMAFHLMKARLYRGLGSAEPRGPLFKFPSSDRRYDGFIGPAVSAIIDAQIKTGVLRLDTGQYQRHAAFGAGRPKVVDKLKIKRVHHVTDQSAPLRSK